MKSLKSELLVTFCALPFCGSSFRGCATPGLPADEAAALAHATHQELEEPDKRMRTPPGPRGVRTESSHLLRFLLCGFGVQTLRPIRMLSSPRVRSSQTKL